MSTLPRDQISLALQEAVDSGRPALVPFITAGYPDKDAFIATLKQIAIAGDVIEVGVPFSDPMADGVTIQRSSHAAIAAGVSLRWILSELRAAGDIGAPVVLMSYLNPLLTYGFEKLVADSAAAGVCGFIVPDLPWEESAEFRAALDAEGLALVQLVSPATPDDRLELLCKG
ncbi:MAG: tryptophan synthase subunit alpha, partial [Gammaproteobacteria bacterium]|nr:tryptophan synthase subunit alpha [Gammaproteobacteria bacterium]